MDKEPKDGAKAMGAPGVPYTRSHEAATSSTLINLTVNIEPSRARINLAKSEIY